MADKLSGQLTDEEKARLCVGGDYWHTAEIREKNIPSLMVSDGPNGLRKQADKADLMGLNASVPATAFPTASALAASFDTELIYDVGAAIGEECRREGISLLLGPGINIKRHPFCGRSFEYFSEDPVVSGHMGTAFVEGVQSCGVGACVKHFAANNQEYFRMLSDSVVDERALWEIYLRAFEMVVHKARPWAVMSSYNKLNGVYTNEDGRLLKDILRDKWGFDGMVITDWGGMNDQIKAIQNGCNLEMPGGDPKRAGRIVHALRDGTLSRQSLDESVNHVLSFIAKAENGKKDICECDAEEHMKIAQKAAEGSAVLLKNDGILPVRKESKIALIGAFAKAPRYQGAGSSKINPVKLDCLYEAFAEMEIPFCYAEGYSKESDAPDEALIAEAEAAARNANVVIIVAGLPDSYESEGFDRNTFAMPAAHNELICRVSAANPHTIVVLQCGSPVEIPWEGHVQGILLTYLSGCMGGHALARLLTGDVAPSGKLAESWPVKIEDHYVTPIYPVHPQAVYKESIFVGYRYYEKVGKSVQYPFGYGLSYTDFEYKDICIENTDKWLSVSCIVKNTGEMAGAEVVQCYFSKRESRFARPVKELKGFQKIFLEPGEGKRVQISIDKNLLTVYSRQEQRMLLEEGVYTVMLAASSEDIRLHMDIELAGERVEMDERDTYLENLPESITEITNAMYETVYGGPLPAVPIEKKPEFTINATLSDLKGSCFGNFLGFVADRFVRPGFGNDPVSQKMYENLKAQTPLRGLSLSGFRFGQIDGIVDMANGKFIRGIRTMLKG